MSPPPPAGDRSLGATRTAAERALREAGIENAAWEVDVLLEEALGSRREVTLACRTDPFPRSARMKFEELVDRRAAREPLQHIVGHWPFLDLDLVVDARALIPRPETEDVALAAIALLAEDRPTRAVDVGTGTGCLALALAQARPKLHVVAIDAHPAALSLALENVQRCGLLGRVDLVCGDLLAPLSAQPAFDLVVANLPYVAEADWAQLEPEVREYDPLSALVAGDDGFALIARLIAEAPSHLTPGGAIVLEIAPQLAGRTRTALASGPWRDVRIDRDRHGRERIASARIAGARSA